MGSPISLEDIGYGDIPEIPQEETGPRSLSDIGLQAVDVSTGQPVKSAEELGYYPEELESAKRRILAQQPDPRSWGEYIGDTASNVGKMASGMMPTALGGEGRFGISDIPMSMYEGAQAPGKLLYGDVPMYDPYTGGNIPTEEGIAEGLKFTGTVMSGAPGAFGASASARGTMAQRGAGRRIANAISADVTGGRARGLDPNRTSAFGPRALPGATPEQLAVLGQEGVPVTGYDLSAGPNLKNLVETSAIAARDKRPAVGLAQGMAERTANSGNYAAATIDNIAGRQLATGDEFQAAVQAIKDTNDPNYKAVMSMPEHQQVFSPELKTLLEGRDVFRKALAKRAVGIENRGGTQPPIYDNRGRLNIQPYNAPSLEYLNDVYRSVRDAATDAFKNGDTTRGNDLKAAANDLRSELDKLSVKDASGNPVYRVIRDDASELFGAKNALEAGYKFTQTAAPMKLNEINSAYQRYSPYQKEQFRVGLLASLKDQALKPGGMAKITSYFDGSNPQVYARVEGVLGPDDAARLGNQLRLQKIVNEGKAPVLPTEVSVGGPGKSHVVGLTTLGGALALGGERLLESFPQVAHTLSSPITMGAVGAGVAGGTAFLGTRLIKAARNSYQQAVAKEVLDAITTNDPAKFAALERHPPGTLKVILDRATGGVQRGAVAGAGEAGDRDDRQFFIEDAKGNQYDAEGKILPSNENIDGQSSGGRIARKAGGRIKGNPISDEVKQVRALLAEKTASMLSIPDDAIATALHIAKGS